MFNASSKGINNVPFALDGTEKFAVDFTKGLTPLVDAGDGYVHDADDGSHTHTDFEGIVRKIKAEEVRCQGSRRVENLVSDVYIGDLFTSTIGATITADGDEITATYLGSILSLTFNHAQAIIGDEYIFSFEAQLVSGSPSIVEGYGGGTGLVPITFTPTTEWKRYSWTDISDASGTVVFGYQKVTTGSWKAGDAFKIRNIQVEKVNGQSNKNPSEYVSVGEPIPSVIDLTFSDGGVGWTNTGNGTLDFSAGKMALSVTAGQTVSAESIETFNLRPNTRYKYSFTVSDWELGTVMFLTIGGTIKNITGNNVYTGVITTGATPINIITAYLMDTGTASFSIDNLSVIDLERHGSNVDGVKYFDTINGNTVASNIVAEATGKRIQSSVRKGILIEEERTNYLLHSETFASPWAVGGATLVSTTEIAPDGEASSYRLDISPTNATHDTFYYLTSRPTNTKHTFSAYIKDDGARYVAIQLYASGAERYTVLFDLSTGLAVDTDVLGATATYGIIYVGNGWYRCHITMTNTSGEYFALIGASESATPTYSGGVPIYLATAGSDLLIWGAQLERGEFQSSYIPTTSATATRSLEELNYSVANLSDSFSLFIELSIERAPDSDIANSTLFHGFASTGNYIKVALASNGTIILTVYRDTDFIHVSVSNEIINGKHKIAFRSGLSLNDTVLVVDGVQFTPISDDNQSSITYTSLTIGSDNDGSYNANIEITNTKIWDGLLTVEELKALTS